MQLSPFLKNKAYEVQKYSWRNTPDIALTHIPRGHRCRQVYTLHVASLGETEIDFFVVRVSVSICVCLCVVCVRVCVCTCVCVQNIRTNV